MRRPRPRPDAARSPKRPRQATGRIGPAVMAALTSAGAALAQPVMVSEPPRPLTVEIVRPTLSMEVEDTRIRSTRSGARAPSEDDTFDWTPALGLQFDGSVYHPKLLQFDIETENGFTRGTRHLDDGIDPVQDSDRHFTLQRYRANATLLRDKPDPVTFFGSKNREERTYDEFNRLDVDTETYGVSTRGIGAYWNWNLRIAHNAEQVASLDRPSNYRDDSVSLNAAYRRDRGETVLRYDDQTFWRQDGGVPAYDGVQRILYVMDEASYSTNRDDHLRSSFNLSNLSETQMDSRSLTVREDWRHQQRVNVWDGVSYQYDLRERDGAQDDLHNGEVYLEHRADLGLDSRADLQGEHERSQSETMTRVGPGITESFTRPIGAFDRLNINLAGRWDHIARSSPGSAVTVIGEHVRLDDSRPVFLALPSVRRQTVVVSGDNGARRFIEGFDYRVVSRGSMTELQRVFGGTIPNGSTVLVDYIADAGTSDSLDLLTRRAAIEYDFYDRLLFLYGEQRAAQSLGGESSTYQTYRDSVLGVKNRWSWLELGVEHVDHATDTFGYDGVNYYADLFWDGRYTSCKFHAGQSSLDYRDQAGTLDTRSYTATLGWTPGNNLTVQGFAGKHLERTLDGDRDLITLEGRLIYRLQRLAIDGTYRFEDESSLQETYERHYFFVRIVREL